MAYGSPSYPVAGTIITVSYAVTNILDPLRWLRNLTGNADPPGSSYVVVSDSTSGTTWRKVPADALAAGVAVANLGYAPVSRSGDTMTGNLLFTPGSGITLDSSNPNAGHLADSGGFSFFTAKNDLFRFYNQLGVVMLEIGSAAVTVTGQIAAASGAIVGALSSGSFSTGGATLGNTNVTGTLGVSGLASMAAVTATTVTSVGAVQGSRLVSAVSDGTTAPITINAAQAGVTNVNLRAATAVQADAATTAISAVTATNATNAANAALLDSLDSTDFARLAAPSNFTTAPTIGGSQIWTAGNDGAGSGLDADTLDGVSSAGFATAAHTHTMLQTAVGTYAGSGTFSTSKTVNAGIGFTPSLVIVTGTTGGASKVAIINKSTMAVAVPQGGTATSSADGTIGAGSWSLNALFNVTGESYTWWAIG